MNEQEVKKRYYEICELINNKQLKEAFDILQLLIEETDRGDWKDEILRLNTNYQYMLQYTLKGAEDPERERVYKKIQTDSIFLAQLVKEALLLNKSTDWIYQEIKQKKNYIIENGAEFYETLCKFHVEQELISLVEDPSSTLIKLKEHHNNLTKLFKHYLLIDSLAEDDVLLCKNIILSNQCKMEEKCILVSSLTLNLLHFFDPKKVNLLFNAYDASEKQVKERALVGLLLVLYQYDRRIVLHPKILSQFQLISDNMEFKNDFENILAQLIRSKETEKLQRKLHDEILPEMVKLKPNLKNKLDLDELLKENATEDKNPEWEKLLENSPELQNKMQELSELQMEGDDVFMGSFAKLKQYPFFYNIENWFFPFTEKHPLIKELSNADDSLVPITNTLVKTILLCNSDKYSFCFSLSALPDEYKSLMTQSLEAEMQQSKELENDEVMIHPEKRSQGVIKQYIQDMYRFFKLFNNRASFYDIFSWKMDFHNKTVFLSILKENKTIFEHIAELYFAKNYFKEAGECFDRLLEEKDSGILLQKRAFCLQKQGNYKEALEYYLKAELFDTNKGWNLKKIALCYRHCNMTTKALEYYRQVEQLEPEDVSTQISIGNCLLDLGDYEEALKCFFKVEYLNPQSSRVYRPIGWCSFVIGKFEQAEKYYTKIINTLPTANDYINLGHIYWCTDKRVEALENYKKSISIEGKELFFKTFAEDQNYIIDHGIKKEEIPLLLDQLRYWIEEE